MAQLNTLVGLPDPAIRKIIANDLPVGRPNESMSDGKSRCVARASSRIGAGYGVKHCSSALFFYRVMQVTIIFSLVFRRNA